LHQISSPKLMLRRRKGDWYKLEQTIDNANLMFVGVVEIYNVSGRANAIRDYEFWGKRNNDAWEKMDSELFLERSGDQRTAISNLTPLTLAPYSGAEARVMAYGRMPKPREMQIKVQVEDLFGRHYHVEVKATS
jgi:hypothetical protein